MPTLLCDLISEYAHFDEEAENHTSVSLISLYRRNDDETFEVKTVRSVEEARCVVGKMYKERSYDSSDMSNTALIFVSLQCVEAEQWRSQHVRTIQAVEEDAAMMDDAAIIQAYLDWFQDPQCEDADALLTTSAVAAFFQLVTAQPTLSFAPPERHAEILELCNRLPVWFKPNASLSQLVETWVDMKNEEQEIKAMAVKTSFDVRSDKVVTEIINCKKTCWQDHHRGN